MKRFKFGTGFRRFGMGHPRTIMFPLIAMVILILMIGAIVTTQKSPGKISSGLPPSATDARPAYEGNKSETITGEPQPITLISPHSMVQPAFGDLGSTLTFSGSGFSPNSSITLHVKGPDDREIAQIRTNSNNNGSFSYPWESILSNAAGTYSFWAVDDRSGKTAAPSNFTLSLNESETEPEPTPDFNIKGILELWKAI
jgi:hypothetical protein